AFAGCERGPSGRVPALALPRATPHNAEKPAGATRRLSPCLGPARRRLPRWNRQGPPVRDGTPARPRWPHAHKEFPDMGQSVVVLGAQWGDEGKGKIVDLLTEEIGAVVRFQGGHNAGHTLVIGG